MAYHTRSISLPSTPNLITAQFEEQFCRLRSSEEASTSSSLSLSHKLTCLTELHSFVDELLQRSSNHQSLSQIQSMLEGSLRLLDICSLTRDILSQSREQVVEIQSVLRRRCSGELNITSEVSEYLKTRKAIKKTIKKCLKNIKDNSPKTDASEFSLNNVEDITVDIFASILSYICGSTSRTSWSVISNIIHKKEASVGPTSEFEAVDMTLESVVCHKKLRDNIENIRNQMLSLESEIEEFDQVLGCLFRYLVKTRSTLLNIVSNSI